MMKRLLLAPVAALLLAGAAHAAPTIQTLTLDRAQTSEKGMQDVFGVETHRSAMSIIAQDALYGGIAGLAIGGGVALLNNDGNWGRDLAIGAGAGLLIGGIFGAVDAASRADRAYPIGVSRDRGFNSAFSPVGGKF